MTKYWAPKFVYKCKAKMRIGLFKLLIVGVHILTLLISLRNLTTHWWRPFAWMLMRVNVSAARKMKKVFKIWRRIISLDISSKEIPILSVRIDNNHDNDISLRLYIFAFKRPHRDPNKQIATEIVIIWWLFDLCKLAIKRNLCMYNVFNYYPLYVYEWEGGDNRCILFAIK